MGSDNNPYHAYPIKLWIIIMGGRINPSCQTCALKKINGKIEVEGIMKGTFYLVVALLCITLVNFSPYARAQIFTIKNDERETITVDLGSAKFNIGYIQYDQVVTYNKRPRAEFDGMRKKFSYKSKVEKRLFHCRTQFGTKIYETYFESKDGDIISNRYWYNEEYTKSNLKNTPISAFKKICGKDENEAAEFKNYTVKLPEIKYYNLSNLAPGESTRIKWGRYTVLVYHRTNEDIAALNKADKSQFKDYKDQTFPFSFFKHRFPEDHYSDEIRYQNPIFRSKDPRYLVVNSRPVLEAACNVSYAKVSEDGYLFEPCRGLKYDLAGRSVGFDKYNLRIPPYQINKNVLQLGNDKKKAETKVPKDPIVYSDVDDEYAVTRAVYYKHNKILDGLLSNREIIKEYGPTALHLAAFLRFKDTIKLLLDKGVDPNFINGANQLPMHIPLVTANFEIAELLYSYGARVNPICHQGQCTSHPLCSGIVDDKHIEVVDWLISKGLSLDAKVQTTWQPVTTIRECIKKYPKELRDQILLKYDSI